MLWGKNEAFLLEIEKIKGSKPPALELRENLYPDMALYMKAYRTLAKSRALIAGVLQPISIQEMKAYCEMYEIQDTDFFITTIQELDDVYASVKRGLING